MLEILLHRLGDYASESSKYSGLFTELVVAPKATLVQEGDSIESIYCYDRGKRFCYF
jgi:hypothetical protein